MKLKRISKVWCYRWKMKYHLEYLNATNETQYSLWKTTKYLRRPQMNCLLSRDTNGCCTKTGQLLLLEHLENVFKPFPSKIRDESIDQMTLLRANITQLQLKYFIINEINHKTSPGYSLITSKVFQELPQTSVQAITQRYNANQPIN